MTDAKEEVGMGWGSSHEGGCRDEWKMAQREENKYVL
jgi:hypothetical protein